MLIIPESRSCTDNYRLRFQVLTVVQMSLVFLWVVKLLRLISNLRTTFNFRLEFSNNVQA
jgi:hypothetical protein